MNETQVRRAAKTAESKARAAVRALMLGTGEIEADERAAVKALDKLEALSRAVLCELGEDAAATLRATATTLRAERIAAVDLRYAAARAAIGTTTRRESTAAELGYERELRLFLAR